MPEALMALDQKIHMVSGNSCNPQVTPNGVYYQPEGQPPYPSPGGQPIVGDQPFTITYGQMPQPSLGQPIINQPSLGTPYYHGMNIIWNPTFTQQYDLASPQVPLYQPI